MRKPRRTGFVDESYGTDETGFSSMILAMVRAYDRADETRQVLRELLLDGAEFLHFSKEDDSRRAMLAKAVGEMRLEPMIVVRRSRDSLARARAVGLTTLAWANQGRLDLMILESRVARPDRQDAELLSKLHPADARVPVRFLGKRADPLLWAADVVASSAFQALVRGVPEHLAALGPVERVDC
jgi:hypothetical protein